MASAGTIAGGVLGVASAYTSYQGQLQQAKGYEAQAVSYTMKARSLKAAKSSAKLNGKITALNLNTYFNDTMANQAVMNAAQGRRGATVEAIASAAETQYNWDLDYSELSTEYEIHGIEADRYSALAAAKASERMAKEQRKYAKIGLGMSLIGTSLGVAGI